MRFIFPLKLEYFRNYTHNCPSSPYITFIKKKLYISATIYFSLIKSLYLKSLYCCKLRTVFNYIFEVKISCSQFTLFLKYIL